MPRYTQEHYEDVARILAYHDSQIRPVAQAHSEALAHRPVQAIARSFADLFAADNPGECDWAGEEEHPGECDLMGGFDRARFLAACGLESEG